MQAFSKDQLYNSSLYGMQPPSSDMADATYQYQQYPSSFASSSARPSWSPNWESTPNASTYNTYATPIHVYDAQPSVLPPRSFDTRYIPRSTSSSLAAAMTPYPESAQRTVLPDPTRAPSCGTSYSSSHSSQASPSLSSHHNSPVLATAGQYSMTAAASPNRYAASSITQYPSSGPTGTSPCGAAAPAGRTYADPRATATHSSAAATDMGRRARGVFHVDPFSSTTSEAESAPVSAPVALKHEETSGLSPRVLAFSSTLEPLEDADDPFPLRVEDLATRDEEELYRGLSHAFYVNTAGAQSSRHGGRQRIFAPHTVECRKGLVYIPISLARAITHFVAVRALGAQRRQLRHGPRVHDGVHRVPSAPRVQRREDQAQVQDALLRRMREAVPAAERPRDAHELPLGREACVPLRTDILFRANRVYVRAAFKCPLKDCPKTFTVRSNAKRHLRTHGVQVTSSRSPSLLHGADAGTIGFEAPVVSDVQYAPDMGPGGKLWKVKWVGQG
ncbi:hypothetical protein EWM64_g1277, partial [Hericium alpestre]